MKTYFLPLLGLLSGNVTYASPESDKIVARYDEIMGPKASEAEMLMTTTREDGSTRSYTMKSLKSDDDKFRIWFLGPASVAGQEVLRLGDNAWIYLPNLKRASRIANRDSFQGGDFSNADMTRVNYLHDYQSEILQRDQGRIKLELKAKNGTTAYERIILVVSEKDSQPLEAQYFGASGKLLRSAKFEEVREFQKGYFRPSGITMTNEVVKGRTTKVEFRAIKLDITPAPQRFTLSDLGK